MSYLGNSFWLHGDEIKIVRGKKFPVGLKGKAFWFGPGHYRKNRVGMELESGEKIFLDAGNVENLSYAARIAAEEKIAAEKRAAVAAAVKLAESRYGKPVYGKEAMGAYGGSFEVEMELCDPELSISDIEADLNLLFPVWRGGATLRWRGSPVSDLKINREARKISFMDHYSMCD